MIRSCFCAFFLVVCSAATSAQMISFNNNSAFVTYSSNTDDIYLDFFDDVTVSSSQNVTLRGQIFSDESVLIKPQPIYSIVLKPVVPCAYCMPAGDPPTTVIKPKPGGSGKLSQSTVTLYPVPVYTNLTFNVSNYLVEAYAIFDSAGVLKQQQNLTPTYEYTIDVRGLKAGSYMLRLHLGNNLFFTKHFIKN